MPGARESQDQTRAFARAMGPWLVIVPSIIALRAPGIRPLTMICDAKGERPASILNMILIEDETSSSIIGADVKVMRNANEAINLRTCN